MTEEIFRPGPGGRGRRERYGIEHDNGNGNGNLRSGRGSGPGYDRCTYTHHHNHNNTHNQNRPGPGRPTLNPRAGSFFSTYPMSEALPALLLPHSDSQPLPPRSRPVIPPDDFKPAPPTKPIRIAHPPHSPVPQRSYSRALIVQQPTPNVRNDLGPTPYPHQNSYTMLGDRIYDSPEYSNSNSNSTTFHVGPIPPSFTIDQMHTALRGFNPRLALFDIRLGIIEVEIPFTLNWTQIRDWCERGLVIGGVTIQVRSAEVPDRNRSYA